MVVGKCAKFCCFLGVFILIVGFIAAIVSLVVVLKPKSYTSWFGNEDHRYLKSKQVPKSDLIFRVVLI